MKNKTLFFLPTLVVIVFTAACSGTQQSSTNQTSQNSSTTVTNGSMSVEEQLAVGTLKLEGTDLAVTADEAKTLLPLWRAVKSLSSSDTTAAEELTALYQQIRDSMTSAQVQEINSMQLTQDDINALEQSLGIQLGGSGMNADLASLSDDERATRIAEIQSQNPGLSTSNGAANGPGGNPPSGGSPPGGDALMTAPGGDMTGQVGLVTMGTPEAGSNTANQQSSGTGLIFIDPLINMLTERAGS
jgi:hypothetical protein